MCVRERGLRVTVDEPLVGWSLRATLEKRWLWGATSTASRLTRCVRDFATGLQGRGADTNDHQGGEATAGCACRSRKLGTEGALKDAADGNSFTILFSNQAREPAGLKHINKRRKRN